VLVPDRESSFLRCCIRFFVEAPDFSRGSADFKPRDKTSPKWTRALALVCGQR
jgi:hypothetical protein